jgi:hypothetical protein
MRCRFVGGALVGVVVSVVALVPVAIAQSVAGPRSDVPRTADGKPDFSGVWQAINTADWNILDHPASQGVPPGLGVVDADELPYRPEMLAKRQENYEKRLTDDTSAKCFLPGVPRIMYKPHPFHIFQSPNVIAMLFEYAHAIRNIYMDTPHPRGPIEWWLGDARGRWESDTLVVDNTHFNDQTWFDRAGNFHSEALHVVERFTFDGPDHINYVAEIEDQKVFTRPWTMRMILYRRKEARFRILEFECYTFEEEAKGILGVKPPGS